MLEMIPREYWLQINRELKAQAAELEKMAFAEITAEKEARRKRRERLCRQYDEAIERKNREYRKECNLKQFNKRKNDEK